MRLRAQGRGKHKGDTESLGPCPGLILAIRQEVEARVDGAGRVAVEVPSRIPELDCGQLRRIACVRKGGSNTCSAPVWREPRRLIALRTRFASVMREPLGRNLA